MTLFDHDDGDEDDAWYRSGDVACRVVRDTYQFRFYQRRIVGRDVIATFIISEPAHARRDHDPGDESEGRTVLKLGSYGAAW